MAWLYAIYFVVVFVLAYAMTPKPQNAKPAGLSEFQLPTAEVGREIPVLFGTGDINGPNVVYYGDLRTVPVMKEGGKE